VEILTKQGAEVVRGPFVEDVVKEMRELVHFREIEVLVGEESDNQLRMV
jgi:hypothetical protein